MIHPYDTHFWMAKAPGGWISAEDHASYEPIFQTATKIRIEPLSLQSIQAVLEAEVPAGYTAFLRTDIHQDVQSNRIARLGYIMAMERGTWPEPGKVALSELPIGDGFRAELCCWNGQVDFVSSPNFSYEVSKENGQDIYRFMKR
jgi:hypothetical protein